jgi:epoxide hydrolase 4
VKPGLAKFVQTKQVKLHVMEFGNAEDPVVLLLHGFPDFWFGWKHQIPALTQAGFRVIVPDQRGYNLSEKPTSVSSYALPHLVDDIVAVIEAHGGGPVYVAGHDWGGIVAWELARRHPELVRRLVIINSPHPKILFSKLWRSPRQLLKSHYMFLFQLPWLPERMIRRQNFDRVIHGMGWRRPPKPYSSADLTAYRAAWAQPGALTAMLNWYRALFRNPGIVTEILRHKGKIEVPTHILWGETDAYLSPSLALESLALCEEGQVQLLKGVSHWVPYEAADRCNQFLLDHFRKKKGR